MSVKKSLLEEYSKKKDIPEKLKPVIEEGLRYKKSYEDVLDKLRTAEKIIECLTSMLKNETES